MPSAGASALHQPHTNFHLLSIVARRRIRRCFCLCFQGTLQTGLRAQQLYSDTTRLLFSGLERQFQNGNFSDIVVLTPAGKRLKYVLVGSTACMQMAEQRDAIVFLQGREPLYFTRTRAGGKMMHEPRSPCPLPRRCHQLVLSACSKKFAGALENGAQQQQGRRRGRAALAQNASVSYTPPLAPGMQATLLGRSCQCRG